MTNAQKLDGFVGFANLPNQIHRKSVKDGFDFTLLIVGESGLGKKTFVNTLFNTSIFPRNGEDALDRDNDTVQVRAVSKELDEGGVKLRLTVVECPGFGDFVNNEEGWKPILEEIDARLDEFMDQERRVHRRGYPDRRIHCVLYFIPTGHGLRPLDIDFMKRVQGKVNIIPVIAKADTLTKDECASFKARILDDISFHKIEIFKLTANAEDDEEIKTEMRDLESKIPFAVIGSEDKIEVNGKKVFGRQYPWGVIEVENEAHCDFMKLRHLLIHSHMEDLREVTAAKYEVYRQKKLESTGDAGDNGNPLARFEQEKKQFEQKMKKMDADMKQIFSKKVKEKEARLKHSKDKMLQDHADQKEQLERMRKELEEKKRQYLDEQKNANASQKKKRSGLF